MLDDGNGGGWLGREFSDQLEGGVGIVEVVVGEFLALMLDGCGDAVTLLAVGIEGRRLMRVLAVARTCCARRPPKVRQVGAVSRRSRPAIQVLMAAS